jgi:hypothetical protein
MSNPPPLPPQGDDSVLAYGERQPKLSAMALTSMILGIIGVVTLLCAGIGLLPGIVALILGIISLVAINREPQRLGGKGFAIAGIVLGGMSFLALPLLIAILLPSLGRARELANRGTCSANLRGIVQSMAVYGVDNMDAYPVVPFAPYNSANAGTGPALAVSGTPAQAVESMYKPGSPVAGAPLAGPWILVMDGSIATRQFLCKSDKDGTAPAMSSDSTGSNYVQFQADNQISYSFDYPYTHDGKVGGWWRNETDASLPIAADMAPLTGTGKPKRDVAAPGTRAGNSGNHGGEGQNVVFGDNHVEFKNSSAVGQGGDNIYTLSGMAGGAPVGVAPKVGPLDVDGTPGNYDTVMVPERDLDTGKLW